MSSVAGEEALAESPRSQGVPGADRLGKKGLLPGLWFAVSLPKPVDVRERHAPDFVLRPPRHALQRRIDRYDCSVGVGDHRAFGHACEDRGFLRLALTQRLLGALVLR